MVFLSFYLFLFCFPYNTSVGNIIYIFVLANPSMYYIYTTHTSACSFVKPTILVHHHHYSLIPYSRQVCCWCCCCYNLEYSLWCCCVVSIDHSLAMAVTFSCSFLWRRHYSVCVNQFWVVLSSTMQCFGMTFFPIKVNPV